MFAALMTTPSAIDSGEQTLVALKAMLGKRHEPFRAGPEKEKYADAYEKEIRTLIKELTEPREEFGRSSGSAVRSHSGRGTVSQSRKPTPLML
jgi:hypothetical protein